MTPFQDILGADFDILPVPVRALHALSSSAHTSGRAEVTVTANPATWMLRTVAGLPGPGKNVAVSVSFHPRPNGTEYWVRCFAGRRYASTMVAGRGGDGGLLIERFGPFRLMFRLTPSGDALRWSLVRWRFLLIPLPSWTRPVIDCSETGETGHFNFNIDVIFPLVGHVMNYRGCLV
jgi:hypothetical protein